MKAAPSCRGQERKGNLPPSRGSWLFRGPRPARPSRRLLSRTWMRLSGDPARQTGSRSPMPSPVLGAPGLSQPASTVSGHWAGSRPRAPLCPAGEAEASLKMSSQNGPWGPLPLHVCCLGLAFIDPREKNQVTPCSRTSHGALSGWKPGRAFPWDTGDRNRVPHRCCHSTTPP